MIRCCRPISLVLSTESLWRASHRLGMWHWLLTREKEDVLKFLEKIHFGTPRSPSAAPTPLQWPPSSSSSSVPAPLVSQPARLSCTTPAHPPATPSSPPSSSKRPTRSGERSSSVHTRMGTSSLPSNSPPSLTVRTPPSHRARERECELRALDGCYRSNCGNCFGPPHDGWIRSVPQWIL